MSKFEDLLGKKKAVVSVLDLSKNVIQSKEEFKRLMEKVPDYKMRPIKVRADELQIKDQDYSFKPMRKEIRKLYKKRCDINPLYIYADPVPVEMMELVLSDLCAIPIGWKMLTTLRPKARLDEDYFSRLVEMGKWELKTIAKDRREFLLHHAVKKLKNKSGLLETRIMTCHECGEELCFGHACAEFSYDLFGRVEVNLVKPTPTIVSNSKFKLSGPKKGRKNQLKSKAK